MRRRPTRPLVSALAAVLAATAAMGCGGSSSGSGADPAKIAPPATVFYVSVMARPGGAQKAAIDSIVRKFGGPSGGLDQLIEQAARRSGGKVRYNTDVKPWLGKRAAIAITNFRGSNTDGVVIVATKDPGKAIAAVRKGRSGHYSQRSYRGVSYDARDTGLRSTAQGTVDGFLVAGSEPGFKSVVDASKGQSLADSADFTQARQRGDGKLGFAYLDLKGTLDTLAASGQLGSQAQGIQALLGGANPKPFVATLDAQSNRVTLEFSTATPTGNTGLGGRTPLLSALPGDAWAALGVRNVGPGIRQLVNAIGSGLGGAAIATVKSQLQARYGIDLDRDVFAAIGDIAAFARGTGPLTVGGGLVIQSPDPAAAKRLIAKLGALVKRQGAAQGVKVTPTSVAGGSGVKVTAKRLPGAINAVVKGDKLVIAYGDPATSDALNPSSRLGDSSGFKAATGALGGAAPSFYVAFGPILTLADSVSSTANYKRARPYLAALDTFAAGGRKEGNTQVARVVVSLK